MIHMFTHWDQELKSKFIRHKFCWKFELYFVRLWILLVQLCISRKTVKIHFFFSTQLWTALYYEGIRIIWIVIICRKIHKSLLKYALINKIFGNCRLRILYCWLHTLWDSEKSLFKFFVISFITVTRWFDRKTREKYFP